VTTVNILGSGLSGLTGSGNFVGANTPTLITPNIGAATGTSLNLSGLSVSSALATDGSKNLVSVTNIGSGNNVLATSPTITTPVISSIVNTGTLTLPTATGTIWASGSSNTNSSQPAFLAKPSSDQFSVTGDGTGYTLALATEIFDQANNFSSNTFTAPVTGKYLFCIECYLYSVGNQTSAELYLNTTARQIELTRVSATNTKNGSSQLILCGSMFVSMTANDTATASVVVSGGSSGKSVNMAASTYFSGVLIC
jgi:hypothetical protein